MNSIESTPISISTQKDWDKFRAQMPVAQKWAYFDHACVAPIPQVTADAMSQWTRESSLDGDVAWPGWLAKHDSLRRLVAQMINAAAEEIALIPNTTFGINLVADGFPWRTGDNVVMPDHEFPSNVYPWMALESRGVELRRVELDGSRVDANRIADACDERTRIVSVSWIGYASGYRIDPSELATVAHDAGALFFLDAIQGLGVHALDVEATGVDFLAADGHKWLLGPEGAGLFYCRREHLNLLRPMNIGWNSVNQGIDFSNIKLDFRHTASRYEGGTQNMAGFIGLYSSLRLLMDFGLTFEQSPIREQVLAYSDQICEALESVGAKVLSDRSEEAKSGIVSFEVQGKPAEQLVQSLRAAGVVVSQRAGRLRISAHCYNNLDDIDRLVETLRR